MRAQKITNIENDFFHLTYEKQKSTLKEKEITRDYYLKRMLIWQQISSPFSSFIVFVISIVFAVLVAGFFGWKLPKEQNEEDDNLRKTLLLALLAFFVLIACLFAFSTYYSRQYWKSYKECQELTHSILATETEREISINA